MSGSIPSGLGGLASLTILDLHSNQLSGSIPTELGNLTNLTILDLHSNQLTRSRPSWTTSPTSRSSTCTATS
ncbi:leucine-rich repeat domain-containing protein [Candidatus Poriferisodalis sp.]|uniref:leucine-rich repeat domain-containing protein n=1 Tax=Candidatus Poriferisodalis sp. TaxID=3101277 RepID=UPI003B525570